jgi:hypothetical protein
MHIIFSYAVHTYMVLYVHEFILPRSFVLVKNRPCHLKGQCHEIFCFWFFHESPSPKPLKITLKIFSICLRCQRHRWCTLNCEYLREFSKKFEMALMVYSEPWEKLIHEKKQKLKIPGHCPFKVRIVFVFLHIFTDLFV